MPRPLPDELLEEVLRRLPPQEPAELIRAALVSRRWWRLVSDHGFRRRFGEFHHKPPMLGMLCDTYNPIAMARFIPTTAFCTPRTDFRHMRVLDARHGRVLFHKRCSILVVWDPITNEVRELPFPKKWGRLSCWKAAILCSAAGPCDHLDCHGGPFLIVFVSNNKGNAVVYTYSSDAASWSELVIGQDHIHGYSMGSALVGNAVYFHYYDRTAGSKILKYNFELRQVLMIQVPSSLSMFSMPESVLLTTMDDSKLCLWSRKDTNEVDAIWERIAIIQLNTVFPIDVEITKLWFIGCGVGIIFMRAEADVYTIDLKTYEVKKQYKDITYNAIPYMSFYTPALKVACSSEEAGAGGSSA